MEYNELDLKQVSQFLKGIILKSGEMAMEQWGNVNEADIEYKKPGNHSPVTATDKKISDFLTTEILKKYPDFAVVSEEAETNIPTDGKPFWIIDPIDGTANFIKGDKNFSITVALSINNKIVLGVIFFPVSNEYFESKVGEGVLLNNQLVKKLNGSTICYAYRPQEKEGILNTFGCEAIPTLKCVTRELTDIARGRAEGGYYLKVYLWDYAAGALMINELGGKVTNLIGEPFKLADKSIIAYSNVE